MKYNKATFSLFAIVRRTFLDKTLDGAVLHIG